MPTDAEKIKELEAKLKYYEEDGVAKLFYALNRKSAELADILNKHNLSNLDLADAKDKTYERIKTAWGESVNIASAVQSLAQIVHPTNDETKDTTNPKYRITTPESMSNVLGNSAGQIN